MKPNISPIHAFIRLIIGFTMLSIVTAKLSSRPHCTRYRMGAFMSAMTIAEGLTRFCPYMQWLTKPSSCQCEHSEYDQNFDDYMGNPS